MFAAAPTPPLPPTPPDTAVRMKSWMNPTKGAAAAAAAGVLAVVASGHPEALALMAGVALLALYVSGGKPVMPLLCAAAVALLAAALQPQWSAALVLGRKEEGFADAAGEASGAALSEEAAAGAEEAEEAAAQPGPRHGKALRKKAALPPPPNNRERREMLELGKKYEVPHEDDDGEFHLDAGSTFLNAYKSLKPDQIAAMTKDTKELMETQKQLMATLHTLKPLITDGKDMLNMFNSYFGEGGATTS